MITTLHASRSHHSYATAKTNFTYKKIPGYHQASGLTFVELLVSLVLISFAVIASSSIVQNGIFGLRSSESNYDTQNLIDRNLSSIEDMVDAYTCTNIPCTVASTLPSKTGYISPSNTSDWASFKDLCDETLVNSPASDLISPLVEYINDNLPAPTSLFRDITVNGSGNASGFARIRHFTVQYRSGGSTGPVLRNSTFIPTVVSYCP